MAKSKRNGSGCAIAGAGCGLIIIVALAAMAVVGYFGFKMLKGSYSGIKQLADIALIENEVVKQTVYVPPTDGLLSLEQVESLVYIQTQIKDGIGPQFEELVSEHRTLVTELEQMNDLQKIRKLLSISGKLVKPLSEAKRAQIDAINREGISMSEYRWLQQQAMQSLGIPQKKFDIRGVLDAAKGEGNESTTEDQTEIVVHPDNQRLLQPHASVLVETLMFSAIGI